MGMRRERDYRTGWKVASEGVVVETNKANKSKLKMDM